MKDLSKYLIGGVIAAIIIFLFLKSCKGENNDTITVTVPETKGESPVIKNPEPIKLTDTIYYPVPGETDTIKVPIPDNDDYKKLYVETLNKYLDLKDTISKLRAYADAIAIRQYDIPVEDSLLLTNNHITAQGKVLDFKQTYTLKSRILKVDNPMPKYSIVAGLELGNNIKFDSFTAKGNLYLQNRNGNMWSVSADTEERFYIGRAWTLFKFPKK